MFHHPSQGLPNRHPRIGVSKSTKRQRIRCMSVDYLSGEGQAAIGRKGSAMSMIDGDGIHANVHASKVQVTEDPRSVS